MARCTSFVAPRRCTSVQLTYVCFSIVILYGFWHGKNHQLKPPFKGNCCFCWIQASQAIPSCFGLFWVISLGGFCLVYIYPEPFWWLYIMATVSNKVPRCLEGEFGCVLEATIVVRQYWWLQKWNFFVTYCFLAQNVAPQRVKRPLQVLGNSQSTSGKVWGFFCEMLGSLWISRVRGFEDS